MLASTDTVSQNPQYLSRQKQLNRSLAEKQRNPTSPRAQASERGSYLRVRGREAFAEATTRFRPCEIQASGPDGGRISHCAFASSPVQEASSRTTEVSGHESIDSSFLAWHGQPVRHSATRDRFVRHRRHVSPCRQSHALWASSRLRGLGRTMETS